MASAVQAPPQVTDVTLSLFAGLKTDIAPADIPEGLSPDNQDMIYLPGDAQSRPCLNRLFPRPLSAGSTVVYSKTYVQPNNDPLTLLLTSDGVLWVEDVGNSPGVANPIRGTNQMITVPGVPVTPKLYAQSVSAFGREYLAFSDLLHGQGIPLQFDGTYLDRVTMDGPGASPTVADYIAQLGAVTINLAAAEIAIAASPTGAVQTGNVVTITTSAAHGYYPGQIVFVFNVAVAGYNGLQTIQTCPSTTTFTYTLSASGLAGSGGGSVTLAIAQIQTGLAENSPPQINAGDYITVNGGSDIWSNNQNGNPPNWQVLSIYYQVASTQWIILFSFATAPATIAAGTGSADSVILGGQSSPGVHQVVCMWLTRQGALSAPSPPLNFVSAGNTQWKVTNLPVGPPNVVARVLAFTGAGGDNFFTIPANVNLPNLPAGGVQIPFAGLVYFPVVIQATVIPDNSSNSAILDVPDNALFDAIAIDQIGNDLFDQRVLGPVLGFYAYASRLACWGDYTKIENLLNMGFCGGYLGNLLTPTVWAVVTAGGTLINGLTDQFPVGPQRNGPWLGGMVWQITGDGTINPIGQLSQSGYLDASGAPILSPSTQYIFRLWGKNPGASPDGAVVMDFYSPSVGVLATATIPFSQFGTSGNFAQANFNAETPVVIPADTIVRFSEIGMHGGAIGYFGELEIVFAQNPYNNTLVHFSYALNPEGFAQTTGDLGAADDTSQVECLALLRSSTLLETQEGVHIFQDNDSEPYQWTVNALTRAVGAVSLRAGDPGKFGTGDAAEDWAVIAGKNGVYLFAGAEFWKVSQEISRGALPFAQDPRPTWDDTNWAEMQTIIAKNDPAARRAYFCVPIGGAVTPNLVFMLDYREMDTATQIASAPPMHITIQGKMKSSDLTRKWSRWNVSAYDCEILVRPGNQRAFFFAGGNGGGAMGGPGSFGNIYSLNPAYLTDDDYGRMFPYYDTYAFVDHDQEQALQLGSGRHMVKKIDAFIAGVGIVTITPIINSLYNFQPALSPRILVKDTDSSNFLASDLEWTTGVHGQRFFFRISVQPLPATTDVQMRIQKLIVWMMKDPIAVFRSSFI